MTPKVFLFLGMEIDNFCFVSNVFWVREFIAATAKCVTVTDDLEIQGHMIFQVYLCFFACYLEYLFSEIQGHVIMHVTLPISTGKSNQLLRSIT
jgi:hypothetical protein